MQKIIDRFVKYIKIDTQSDDENPAFPSTEKQWDLAKILRFKFQYSNRIPIQKK